jgi:hypothetical protein
MIGALFGALSAAMNKAAEVTEDFGHRIGAPQWIVGGLSGGLAMVGKGFEAGQDISLPSVAGGLAFIGNTVQTALGGFTDESPMAPQQGQKLGRSAELHNAVLAHSDKDNHVALGNQMQVQPSKAYEADRGDLGVMRPPPSPIQVARSTGVSLQA